MPTATKTAPAKKPAAPKGKTNKTAKPAEAKYPAPAVELCSGDSAITADRMKEILGWEEVPNAKDDYTMTDAAGVKVLLKNSSRNRPLDEKLARKYAQDLLRKQWRLNGESLIVGTFGEVISGQHRGVALVLAAQMYATDPDWVKDWPDGPPKLETVLVTGIDESDDTVNTIDTGRPRTLADVLYRSEYFGKKPAAVREKLAKITEGAVKLLWSRTGQAAEIEYRTHMEACDFLDRHPKLLKAVAHVYEENQGEDADGKKVNDRISSRIGLGYAAACLYMMAASGTDPKKYEAKRTEKAANMDAWDKAEEFWVLLADRSSAALSAVRDALGTVKEDGNGTLAEAICVLVKAWDVFSGGKSPTAKQVAPVYEVDEDGLKKLVEFPIFGGIDAGDQKDDGPPDAEPEAVPAAGKPAAPAVPAKAANETLDAAREAYPGKVLLFKNPKNNTWQAWGEDSSILRVAAEEAGVPSKTATKNGLDMTYVDDPDMPKVLEAFAVGDTEVQGLKPGKDGTPEPCDVGV